MTSSTSDDNSVLLVHAYLDGELDPANALEIEQRMSTDPALAAEGERVKALRQLIRERLPPEVAPQVCVPASRHRSAVQRVRERPSWRALAASIALTAVVASSSTWLLVGPQPENTIADSLVSDHIRALMAPQPTDVVSSDRHTVKPWFNGRIPESPRVVDLAKQDFPLVGGRLDVVGRDPCPTLVYRHQKHLISLTEMPAGSRSDLARTPRTINGYNVVHWTENGVSYWAISDLAASKLEEFAQLFRATPAET